MVPNTRCQIEKINHGIYTFQLVGIFQRKTARFHRQNQKVGFLSQNCVQICAYFW